MTEWPPLELLRKAAGDGDLALLKEGVAALAQLAMDAEVSTRIGAARGERAPDRRLSQRNGYRERRWDTRVGSIELQIAESLLWMLGSRMPSPLN
jgi:putative transposase